MTSTNQTNQTNQPTTKMTKNYTVPPTREMGSFSGVASARAGLSYRADALCDYNRSRVHDGLEPIGRMPAGTRYSSPYYIIRTGNGYIEQVDEFATRAEARECLTEYASADPAGSYSIARRALA